MTEISERIRKEIIPLLYQGHNSSEVMFHNPHFVSCWIRKECTRKECAAYGNADIACWYRTGTYCDGATQGTYAAKYGECRECDVFKESCPTLVEEVGEALNHLLFSLRMEKKATQQQLEKIEYLNKELMSALENLDARNREIQELVITDKLTGLYNRNYLLTALDDEIVRFQRGNDPLSVMMIDFDNFKTINDTYGHVHGDKILAAFGGMLHSMVRKYDRAFRYGGEEFVILLPHTDLTVAWIMAERIRKAFEKETFCFETATGIHRLSLTLSIGMALYRNGISASQLLEQADEAMYKAKSQGKNKAARFGID